MEGSDGAEKAREFLRWGEGQVDEGQLTPTIYVELKALAGGYLRRERNADTLSPTDLVHEAYLRLIGGEGSAESRSHFVALAAMTMRRILVDHARGKQAAKRISKHQKVTLVTDVSSPDAPPVDVLALDEALSQLAEVSERAARLVELRFFGGLTLKESARALNVSKVTVERDWAAARAWLRQALRP